ncbi:pyrethroid hydrolase Ces2e-like isoform X2 [Cylas formicarius]|uniref:pyrethroid hydrolase Ces2e-like isoform X2 n=1 Tax=Cylas formicarius TaxID=197179 RepID=UPI00295893D5|nr:pyrethroid hydrolase Ces2e-like isoform X2 [Cylas formicarius]XP_060537428.1 pyrethroid hydrolase Ces2e-like isoform X2 [Cylas formicarius]
MFCVYFGAFLINSAFADTIVDLPDGKVRGYEITTNENNRLVAFLGIPYASPPLGNLRFQTPTPPNPWEGIREANQTGAACIATAHFPGDPEPREENEDCLYINVYTPAHKIAEKLPVLFWIYGGGFVGGFSDYSFYAPDYLIQEDVIVVTFNYRLGIFGFMSTGDTEILGNAGLKDQLFALNWTKGNIGSFGGDPDKITIFGQSAGGGSVGFHLTNKKSAGLFRAAICQSGCSLMGMSAFSNPTAYEVAKAIDNSISDKNSTREIREFLQSQPVEVLSSLNQNSGIGSGITMEVEDKDAYITELNFPLVQSGNINRLPLMIGTTSEESLGSFSSLQVARDKGVDMDSDVTSLIPNDLVPLPGSNLTEIGYLIKEAYVGKGGKFADNPNQVVEFSSDGFVRPTLKQAELQSNYTPVYMYQFSFYGTKSENRTIIPGAGKVAHADELAYLFKISTFPITTDADLLTRQRMVRLWANFAKTLNPTPDQSDPILNITWPQVNPNDIRYLDIDTSLTVKPNRKVKEYAMWNRVFYKYGTQPFIGF